MADSARKEKLAAAKKKLKNFQRGGNPSPAPVNRNRSSQSPAPVNRNRSSPSPATNNNGTGKAEKGGNNSHKQHQQNGSGAKTPPEQSFQGQPPKTSTPKPGSKTAAKTGARTNSQGSKPPDVNAAPAVTNHSPPKPLTTTSYQTPGTSSSPATTESTERIHQLSLQLNGLITESSALANDSSPGQQNGNLDALESRNRDLAALVDKHMKANEQLTQQLNDVKHVNTKLQTSLDSEKRGFEDRLKRELGALKEQLQVHIQTIGILVAEKTELQSSLNQTSKQVDQRAEEVEELSGRLKASRQRVADLERSFSTAATGKQKHEEGEEDGTVYRSSKELTKEVDRLKLELYKTNKSNEEFQQKNSELQGKLQKKIAECGKFEESLIDVRGKLEMTELTLQQLQNSGAPAGTTDASDNQAHIEGLLAEKAALLGRIEQYEQQFERVSQERDHISQQYQEYIQQITQQSQALQAQIGVLSEEKESLLSKQRELEVVIQDLKSAHDSDSASVTEASRARTELSDKVATMVMEVGELKHKYETQVADNSQLSRLVLEKEELIMSLELKVAQLSDNQVDSEALLESIQSDKTALSRALAQNRELKQQLAELQNGFVKMSNDNMELLNRFASEQHVAKELGDRLGQQEEELKDMRAQLEQKEQLLAEMQKYAERLQQQSGHSSHSDGHPGDMESQLREFQEATPLIETLQRELTSAQDTINALTNQNSELRAASLQEGGQREAVTSTEQVENLTASIRQLEMERNQILSILQEEKKEHKRAEERLEELRMELATTTPATLNGDVINKAQFEALQHAMKQLEGKYTKAMRDKADLQDKSEQLEHIIMQLQGETDTIAEYITLYQTQRMLLRQRQEEKDDYISRLAREREDQADKLQQLQVLLVQLLNERNAAGYANTNSAPTANHVAHHHHIPKSAHNANRIAGKLDSSHLEDWPDYTSSDSDASDVEPIVGGADDRLPNSTSTPLRLNHVDQPSTDTDHDPTGHDPTAQKILSLLTEIGSAVYMDSGDTAANSSFLHCSHCSGRVISV